MHSVTFAHGGFARVGGIETFTADLASALDARRVPTELICWSGRGGNENPALRELAKTDVRISRTDWRWGCRWGWPDKLMVLHQWKRFADSELLVFGKLLHPDAHRRLQPLRKRMILVTPYRPAEMWSDGFPGHEILNSFEAIVVQARSFREDLQSLGYSGRVIHLPYLPPDTQKPTAWPLTSALQVGFLGRLVPDKNLEYLIRSFSHLSEMGIEAQLRVFGDGPDRKALAALTQQLGLTSKVFFHGNVDCGRITAAIDSCHILAFGSKTEGQPLASLESLARGRPVVGTAVGSFPEYLCTPLGSVAPLDNPVAFAAALKAVAEPVLRGKVSPQDVQHAFSCRFSRRRVIDEYMAVFGCSGSVQRQTQAS
jgi:glycosyltransferase involved in cell wall biosynthesis